MPLAKHDPMGRLDPHLAKLLATRSTVMKFATATAKLVLVAGVVAACAGCGAKVEGTYRGIVRNESYGVSADLFLTVRDRDGMLSGEMALGAPLSGGGMVSGRRDGENFQFTTSDGAGGRIVWIGEVDGKTIGGRYVVEPGALAVLAAGIDKQEGAWAAQR